MEHISICDALGITKLEILTKHFGVQVEYDHDITYSLGNSLLKQFGVDIPVGSEYDVAIAEINKIIDIYNEERL